MMDGFTAQVLLQAAMLNPADTRVADLYKAIKAKTPPDTGLSADQIAAEALNGRRCTIKGTSYVGTVMGANKARGGFYGGERYPILVKVDKTCEGRSATFEYDLDQVLILPQVTA